MQKGVKDSQLNSTGPLVAIHSIRVKHKKEALRIKHNNNFLERKIFEKISVAIVFQFGSLVA